MNWKAIKYALPLTLFVCAWFSFTHTGWMAWSTVIVAFVLVPVLEFLVPASPRNHTGEEEEKIAHSPFFNVLLYVIVPLQFISLYIFLRSMQAPDIRIADR